MEFSDPTTQAWYDSRPPAIQALIRQVPPMGRYHLVGDDTGDWYEVYSYSEGGTISAVRYCGREDLRSVPTGASTDQWIYKKRGQPLWRVFGLSPAELIPIEADEEEEGQS
jgi:hypothetical protein